MLYQTEVRKCKTAWEEGKTKLKWRNREIRVAAHVWKDKRAMNH